MTKIDIFSGFLGAGKTTLIKKLIAEAYTGEKLVLIENEFGEIAVDGGFLKDAGIEVTEMSSGCICCSLVGDFSKALEKVVAEYSPDRILIEPSGVGKLSDVVRAVLDLGDPDLELGCCTTVVDATRARMYMKNFGEFWCNQVESAGVIVLSRTEGMSDAKLKAAVDLLREHNHEAVIVTTPWEELDGEALREAMNGGAKLSDELAHLAEEAGVCSCGHHHEHGEECHHDHEDEHDHHHDHDHEHHHEDDHHEHHHDADEVFTSWGEETAHKFTEEEIRTCLQALGSMQYGQILRAKGIVDAVDGEWIYFDYVPGEADVRRGSPALTGRLCVIGSNIDENSLKELFKLG